MLSLKAQQIPQLINKFGKVAKLIVTFISLAFNQNPEDSEL